MNADSTTTRIDQALAQVREIATQVANGNQPLAQQARQTLDVICWSPDGYPEPVRAALEAAGLRSTP